MTIATNEESYFLLRFKILLFFVGAALALLWLFVSVAAFRAYELSEFQRAGVIAQVSALIMFSAAFSGFPTDSDLLDKLQKRFETLGPEGMSRLIDPTFDAENQRDRITEFVHSVGGPKPLILRVGGAALAVEISILLLGTVQTGYGDWILCSVMEGGVSKCIL